MKIAWSRWQVQRVRGDQRSFEVQVGQKRAYRGDLVGLLVDFLLGDHDTVALDHRGQEMDRSAVFSQTASHGLAVER